MLFGFAKAAHILPRCAGRRIFWRGKSWVIQPLGALILFINSFASQQCIIEASAAPRDMPHHPSRVWQLWRTKQWSAKRAEVARHDGRQHPHRTRHEDDRF